MTGPIQDTTFYIQASVTRWVDYLFNIWPFATMKNLPKRILIAKVGSEYSKMFCQITLIQAIVKSSNSVFFCVRPDRNSCQFCPFMFFITQIPLPETHYFLLLSDPT